MIGKFKKRSSLEELQQRKKDRQMSKIEYQEKQLREILDRKRATGQMSESDAYKTWDMARGSIRQGVGDVVIDVVKSDSFKVGDLYAARKQLERMGAPGMLGGALSSSDLGSFVNYVQAQYDTDDSDSRPNTSRQELEEAKKAIEEMSEILKRIKEDALVLHRVDRMSKDKKHTYVSKQGTELRIKAPEGLAIGHEVLLHPKTMQIVEDLGFPPLEASQFSPTKIPSITWADIGGLEKAKQDMIEAIELPHKHKDLYKFYNKRPIKGVLLSGAPGCGKTMLGKAAANSLAGIYGEESARTGFLYVKAPEILNQYVGQTEQTIRDMFLDANRHYQEHGYPAVIFIDEADAVLATRGTRNVGIGNTIVPAFLTEMDGLEASTAIVVLATNRPDILDPAIVREGRIDRKIHIDRPDLKNAIKIAKLNLQNFPMSEDFDIDILAEGMATELFNKERRVDDQTTLGEIISGAMLATCADLAVSSAIHRDLVTGERSGLTDEDIIYAVERIHEQNQGVSHAFN